MTKSRDDLVRRVRRLQELKAKKQYQRVNAAVRRTWEGESITGPQEILLRSSFVLAGPEESGAHPAPSVVRLLNPRGIALRFYLLAVFEAQCRLDNGKQWTPGKELTGLGGWCDLIAIDAAYSTKIEGYRPGTKQDRTLETSRLRQVHGALRTLADPEGRDRTGDDAPGTDGLGLVEVPRKQNGTHRDYGAFALMDEAGRGKEPTARRYRTPDGADSTIAIPPDFFLNGWVHVLSPTEIATWLTLCFLRGRFPAGHYESGVFLYGQTRESVFHLKRAAYEDGCTMLRALGLIQDARPPAAEPGGPATGPYEQPSATGPEIAGPRLIDFSRPDDPRYQPNRYQLTDEGLHNDGLDTLLKELVLMQQGR